MPQLGSPQGRRQQGRQSLGDGQHFGPPGGGDPDFGTAEIDQFDKSARGRLMVQCSQQQGCLLQAAPIVAGQNAGDRTTNRFVEL